MSETPNESEKTVTDQLGEVAEDQIERATVDARSHPAADAARAAMQDPSRHGGAGEQQGSIDPTDGGSDALSGEMGVSSAATTSTHPETHAARDVSPGSYDAPDPATEDTDPAEDYRNRSWDGPMRTEEPRPAPIEDEKSRRDNIKPD